VLQSFGLVQALSTDAVIFICTAGEPVNFATKEQQDVSPSAPRKKALLQPTSGGSIKLRLKVAPQTGPSDGPRKVPRPKSARIEAVGEKRTSNQSDWDMTPPEKKRIRRSTNAQSATSGATKGNARGEAEQRSSNREHIPWTVLILRSLACVQL